MARRDARRKELAERRAVAEERLEHLRGEQGAPPEPLVPPPESAAGR